MTVNQTPDSAPRPTSAEREGGLAAIERRCEAATPGPWKANEYEKGEPQHGYAWVEFAPGTEWGDKGYMYDTSPIEIADAEFIAHAREDIPILVATIRRLEAAGAGYLASAEQQTAWGHEWEQCCHESEARVAELELDKSEVVGQLSLEHKALEASEAREAALRGALEGLIQVVEDLWASDANDLRVDYDITQLHEMAQKYRVLLATPAPAGGITLTLTPREEDVLGALVSHWIAEHPGQVQPGSPLDTLSKKLRQGAGPEGA